MAVGYITYSDSNKVPLIVYDYVGKNGFLLGGHDINAPAKIYYYQSENSRRETAKF